MSTADAFLRNIRENPDDDTARLVFADWLDENGDPERAEFIRLQIELSRIEWGDPRWAPLQARESNLLDANRDRWLQGLPKACRDKVAFERGFVATASVTGKQFLRWAEKLKERTPLTGVGLNATQAVFAELTRQPVFAGIRELVFQDVQRAAEWGFLARCRHLASLRSLGFWYMPDFTPAPLATLLRSEKLPALRELQLNDYNLQALTSADLESNVVLANLAALRLWRCRLDPLQCEILFSEPRGMRAPERLELWQCRLSYFEVKALVRCPNLRTLKELDLHVNEIGPEGAKALAECPYLGNLRVLNLRYYGHTSEIGDAGAIALAQSRTMPNLESLDLQSNGITNAGARAFLEAKHLPNLRHLNLRTNPAITKTMLARLRKRYEVPE
jgi:uncharacterized protein (TIGR02996 family)